MTDLVFVVCLGIGSSRLVVKPEGVSNVFLTEPVGVNENLGGREAPLHGCMVGSGPVHASLAVAALIHFSYTELMTNLSVLYV